MTMDKFLKKFEKFEIDKYEPPKDAQTIARTHVSFSGSPQKHPYNPCKSSSSIINFSCIGISSYFKGAVIFILLDAF